MAKVEVRERSVTYGETGVGVEDRVETVYELGAEIDGTWVPFTSVSEHRVADFAQREAQAAEAEAEAPASA